MMVFVRIARRIAALQEFFFLLFFRPLGAALRVVPLHVFLFLRRQLGQVANKKNQPPAILVLSVRFPPSWHAAQPDAVVDDVVDLSVGQVLRWSQTHVGCLGVEIPANRRVPAAVIRMADGAVVGKVMSSVRHNVLRECVWVPLILRFSRDRHHANLACQEGFKHGWVIAGGEPVLNLNPADDNDDQEENSYGDNEPSALHHSSLACWTVRN